MQCKSCSETVPPKFQHAIKSNVCPFCGQEIISLELQVALSELGEVLKSAEQYRTEICEWLKANYEVLDMKGDEYKALQEKAEMVNKMPVKQSKMVDPTKVVLDENGNQISGEPLQPNAINKFLNRAEVKVKDQDHYRNIINQIKRGGNTEVSGGGSGGGSVMDVEAADTEEVSAMSGALSSGVPVIQSGLMSSDFDEDGDIPPIVEAMAQQASGKTAADFNAKDVAKLQRLQSKSAQVKKALDRGGSVGLIKRG